MAMTCVTGSLHLQHNLDGKTLSCKQYQSMGLVAEQPPQERVQAPTLKSFIRRVSSLHTINIYIYNVSESAPPPHTPFRLLSCFWCGGVCLATPQTLVIILFCL